MRNVWRLSQEQVASSVGLSLKDYQEIEKGTKNIEIINLRNENF